MTETVAATIIYTDLVDSTKLTTSVAASEAERIRREHFRLLGEAVEAHGGRVVKGLGDGIMAAFPGCSAALDAAAAMQQAIVRHNRVDAGPDLSIRIGVSTGDCVAENGDYFGEPAIQAARLCAAAEGGQVLVAAVVGMLVPRAAHPLTAVGDLELKGIPDPFPALELGWVPPEHGVTDERSIPLPVRVAPGTELSSLVGRVAERTILGDAFKAAHGGERRVVVVTGEAGLGKTRLTTEFASEAFGAGATVLYGRCDEELAVPYLPWVESLGHLVEHAGEGLLTELDDGTVASLARVLPQLRGRIDEVASSATEAGDQYALFGAVCRVLEVAASVQTLVLLLDDLHWADRGTLQLLEHVTTSLPRARLLVVATYRETDLASDDSLTETSARLHRVGGVDRIGLEGLSDVEVLELLAGAAGHDLDDDGIALGHLLRADTSGNPFFVVEMVRHLAETGAIAQHEGRWTVKRDLAELALPQSVRDVVGQRIRRLGAEAHAVLSAAAVVGREFDTDVVAGAADLDDDAVLDAVEKAIRAGLVAELEGTIDRFSFTHALVQHTLYGELTGSRRARMHRRVATCLEETGSREPGELAKHWFAAVRPAELERAVGYAIEAGDRALASAAPDEAVRWFAQALEALEEGDAELRCEVQVRLGDAERQAGHAIHRERLLDAARQALELDRGDLLVRSALSNYRGWQTATGEVDAERVTMLEEALRMPEATDADRARLMATLAGELGFSDDPRRFDLAHSAQELGEATGDPVVVLDALQRVGGSINVPEMLPNRRHRATRMMALTDDRVDPVRRFLALDHQIDVHLADADMEGARRCMAERRAIADKLGQPTFLWLVTNSEAVLDVVEGDVAAAQAGAEKGFQLGADTGQPDLMTYFGALLILIHLHRSQFAEIVPLVRDRARSTPGLSAFHAVLANLLAHAGASDEAAEVVTEMSAGGFAYQRDIAWLTSTAFLAEAAAMVGELDSAGLLYDRLLPYGDQVICTRAYCIGPVGYYLGRAAHALGRAEAEVHFREAIRRSEGLRSPFHRARAMLGVAEVLQPTDPAETVPLLDAVEELAEQYQMPGQLAAARALRT